MSETRKTPPQARIDSTRYKNIRFVGTVLRGWHANLSILKTWILIRLYSFKVLYKITLQHNKFTRLRYNNTRKQKGNETLLWDYFRRLCETDKARIFCRYFVPQIVWFFLRIMWWFSLICHVFPPVRLQMQSLQPRSQGFFPKNSPRWALGAKNVRKILSGKSVS